MEVMKAFKGRGLKWQAAVNSRDANDERLLELAAKSGCFMLSVGFESISKQTLRRAQVPERSGFVLRVGRKAASLWHHGVGPVHVRL